MVPEVDGGVGEAAEGAVGIGVLVAVTPAVGVLLGCDTTVLVGVGVLASVMTNWAGIAPSRDEKMALSVLSGNRAKV